MKWTSTDKVGALPSQMILEMIQAGCITGAREENVKPSSLDLAISSEIYKVEGIFQPKKHETVRHVLDKIKKTKHTLEQPLERDQMYLIRLNERLDLPESVYAFCNPKSALEKSPPTLLHLSGRSLLSLIQERKL